ncbi:Acetate/butyrate--CoA ligase AAE7 [Abeliophyllum distichum]|uniref:Acetate/butyrate--CoA ligase AAE7 n=1 Tax=Abeliophyllum distichum TaxID=126358 RepID=A0ABD1VBE4_9LAMI
MSIQVTLKEIYSAIDNLGVTHFCATPVVLNSMANARKDETVLLLRRTVHVMTTGVAPPTFLLFAMSQQGFRVTHTYGLSETYGLSRYVHRSPSGIPYPHKLKFV